MNTTLLLSFPIATGFFFLIFLFAFCFFLVHLCKFAKIGWKERSSRRPPEKTEQKKEEPPFPEPVYYLVEKKKRRKKSAYTDPKKFSFK